MTKAEANKLIKLKPDNFTPLSRTPWAGAAITSIYKSQILPKRSAELVGESWEFSCDPDFPSHLSSGESLVSLIAQAPEQMLGVGKKSDGCQILVKILNAADPLSVQVHPRDGDVNLAENECGKPESWYVVSAEPGAGIYLGFKEKCSKEQLKTMLLDGSNAKDILQFVPVRPGDYFELEPHVPHAVAPGTLLLEPQRIVFGKSGKTYRLWDWGRKYNAAGVLDQINGKPRQLHLEEGLRLVDPTLQVGAAFVAEVRRSPVITKLNADLMMDSFPKNPNYQLRILRNTEKTEFSFSITNGYAAVLCLSGTTSWGSGITLAQGESGFLPAAAGAQHVNFAKNSILAIIHPADADFR